MSVFEKLNDILNCFLDVESELSLDEISARTGLNKTTARRLAISMVTLLNKRIRVFSQRIPGTFIGNQSVTYCPVRESQLPMPWRTM